MRHALVIATTNRGKLAELRELLAPLPLDVLSIADVSKTPIHVVEDGDTFEANAIKKAREVSAATMMWTLADDSGLEVDVLGGAPGVLSARFAGERATDAENNAALLSALADTVPQTHLRAQFRCVLALVDPFVRDGEPYVVEGTCEGTITTAPRGAGGFGYDPLFVVEGTDKTMAELDEAEKNRLSHRARAMEKLRLVLERTIAARDELTRSIVG
jgi:XTP/dITP diphosphohydrolase